MTNREKLFKVIDSYPKLKVDDLKELSDLENLPIGIYSIDRILPFHLLKVLPYFRNCMGEVGIFCIDNNWILTTSPNGAVTEDSTIAYCALYNLCQFHAHSHPAWSLKDNRYVGNIPSEGDLSRKGIDRKLYIFSVEGFTEISLESIPEEIISSLNNMERTSSENPQDRVDQLNSSYDRYGIIRKTIGFENEEMIMEIINSKKSLTTNFWDEEDFDFLRELYFLR